MQVLGPSHFGQCCDAGSQSIRKESKIYRNYTKTLNIVFLTFWKILANIQCAWPHVVQKLPEVEHASPSSCRSGCQHSAMRVSVRHCGSRSNRITGNFFLRSCRRECPRLGLVLQCGWPKHRVTDHCPKGFRYVLSLRYCRSVSDWNFSAELQFWGTEVRTHAVAGKGGSSGSDVDMVASLRLARVGCSKACYSYSERLEHKLRFRTTEAS